MELKAIEMICSTQITITVIIGIVYLVGKALGSNK